MAAKVILGGDLEMWGYIPDFLDLNDPKPAKEQIAAKYVGGWTSMAHVLKWDRAKQALIYPGDPPFHVQSIMIFRDELLLLFPSSFVLILQKDDTWDLARLD